MRGQRSRSATRVRLISGISSPSHETRSRQKSNTLNNSHREQSYPGLTREEINRLTTFRVLRSRSVPNISLKLKEDLQKESINMGDTTGSVETMDSVTDNNNDHEKVSAIKPNGEESPLENGHLGNNVGKDESGDEDRDEPDAMSPEMKAAAAATNDKSYSDNRHIGCQSGDEDVEDEGRLVIDDDNIQRRLVRKRKLREEHTTELSVSTNNTTADSNANISLATNSSLNEVNLSNNFLGVTPQDLGRDISGVGTPATFEVDEDEEDEADVPSSHDNSSLMMMDRSIPMGLAHTDMDSLDRAFEEDKRKKKKTRQEVDPGKYFEAVDSAGTKYACSQCGNIYKWRKSLNKHWKEKHSQDPLVDSPTPPGMHELLKSGKYTQLGSRRIYDNAFLATIKTQKDDPLPKPSTASSAPTSSTFQHPAAASAPSPNHSNSTTYGQQLVGAASPNSFLALNQASRLAASVASFMPNAMGRFAGQPVFPSMMFPLQHHFQQQQQQAAAAAAVAAVAAAQQNGFDSAQEEGALDLTRDSKPASARSSPSPMEPQPGSSKDQAASPEENDQDQPLDFSKKRKIEEKEPIPSTSREEGGSSRMKGESQSRKEHKCTRCDFSSTSDTEFANHQATHNKRIVHCHECYLQFRSMEDLNAHFMNTHGRKLTDHKEAIKKIPHGLQQTYHLLNMDLRDIGELGNQELGTPEARSLKCNKCTFEAKWPAELQKHAVSHSEERPYVCMVCGSTYKWKWDLVKHFQKSHPNLPNPYRRNDKRESPECSSEEEAEDPELKRARLMMMGMVPDMSRHHGESSRASPDNEESAAAHASTSARARDANPQNALPLGGDDAISVEGIIAATQAGQRVVSSQPNILDDEPVSGMERSLAYLRSLPGADPTGQSPSSHATHLAQVVQAAQVAQMAQAAQEMIDRRNRAQRVVQDSMKRHNAQVPSNNSSAKKPNKEGSPSATSKNEELPYKCTMCNYHARWPSEVTQHMKNHSDSKPYLCPRCDYRSKWKWDVVKHLKRCGGGGINDVIDTTKMKKKESNLLSSPSSSNGPPNVIVGQQGKLKKTTPQPTPGPAFILPSVNEDGIQGATVVRQPSVPQNFLTPILTGEPSRPSASLSGSIDLVMYGNRNSDNNNSAAAQDNNVNNNYSAYSSGLPNFFRDQQQALNLTPPFLGSPKSSSSLQSPPNTSTPVSSSSNSRQSSEMWTCPHCPFSTASQAELKRHSGLHSEDKPFKCDVCQYSTRWACDLKKHRKSYNHFPSNKPAQPAVVSTPSSRNATVMSTAALSESQNKSDAATHEESLGPSPGRFKCSQCNVYFHTMQKLIDHRTNEHIGRESTQSSPAPGSNQSNNDQQGEEIDAARIKHPRKAIKQIQCTKCDFVCKSRQTMEKHLADHEELENSGMNCFYCSAQFRDKDSLLDHLTTHSAFNPGEWETFFMTTDEEDQQQREASRKEDRETSLNYKDEEKDVKEEAKADAPYKVQSLKPNPEPVSAVTSTEERIQKILSEVPKQMPAVSPYGQQDKYKCEWCPAQFPSLSAVYKHASQAHPIQLKEQDNDGVAGSPTSPVTPSPNKIKRNQTPPQQQVSPTKVYTGEPLEILKQQIEEKRNHQLAEKYSEIMQNRLAAAATQPPQILIQPPHINTAVKEESEEGEITRYCCDKCSFSTPSKSTFLRHSELHGGAMPSKCWFCDYSVEHMQLLYQHMKISHTRKWKALSQDPKYAEAIYRMNLAYGNTPQGGNNNDSPPLQGNNVNPHFLLLNGLSKLQMAYPGLIPPNFLGDEMDAMDLSSSKGKTATDGNQIPSASDITFKPRTQYTWNGIPVNVSTSCEPVMFKCPFCQLKDESVAKTCCHVSLSHPPMASLRCRTCRYSDNNMQNMVDHCRTTHQSNERVVDVLEIKALQVNEVDHAQFNILRMKMVQEMVLANSQAAAAAAVAAAASSGVMNSVANPKMSPRASDKMMTCPFCPYKTNVSTDMKVHVPNHSRMARYRCQQCDFSTDTPDIISNHVKVHDVGYQGENTGNPRDSTNSQPKQTALNMPMNFSAIKSDIGSEQRTADIPDSDSTQAQSSDSPQKNGKVNSGRMRYCCSACPYRTTCKSNILKHKRQHQHNKRYKCTKCSYSAARAVLLKNHMDAHDLPDSDSEGHHNDIFCDPHSPGDHLRSDENDGNNSEEADLENDDIDEDDACSDDLNEMDAKAIADLEAKDILEAEAAHKASSLKDEDGADSEMHENCKKTCLHCPMVCNSEAELQKHVSFHNTEEHYKCDFCTYSVEQLSLLTQHRKLHADTDGFDSNPPTSKLLNTNYTQQQQNGTNCDKTSNDESQDSKLTKHLCEFCPYSTSTSEALNCHTSNHGSRKRFLCDLCDYSGDELSIIAEHRIIHKDEHGYTTNQEDEKSPFLNTEFEELASGEFEAKIMDTPMKNGDSSDSPSAPVAPFRLKLVNKSYPCKSCPFKTSSKSSFAAHKAMHGSGDEFSCCHCNYQAKTKGCLQQHVALHQMSENKRISGQSEEKLGLSDTKKSDSVPLKEEEVDTKCSDDKVEAATQKPTRVYVCQHCEEEFESKHLMIQHEKQH